MRSVHGSSLNFFCVMFAMGGEIQRLGMCAGVLGVWRGGDRCGCGGGAGGVIGVVVGDLGVVAGGVSGAVVMGW